MTQNDWSLEDLEKWDKKIHKASLKMGLEFRNISYEIIDYFSMLDAISYSGLPTRYNHWSFGKIFEKTRQLYNLGMEGLPYELIINTSPNCIAYLMRENPLPLQILIMAHCLGHSDFFNKNIHFKDTFPDLIISRCLNAKKRVKEYIEDPSIGIEGVEKILDACHTIRYQCDWFNKKRLTQEEILENLYIKEKEGDNTVDYTKTPLQPEFDVLLFILENSNHFEDWEKDLINIVRQETQYFIPQIKTKIINEGWSAFIHYKMLNVLDMPDEYKISMIKYHNQVVRPILGSINPYHLGFKLFNMIEEKFGFERCLFAREVHHDETFIREYLDEKICAELNLFSYSKHKKNTVIDEISDEDGWESIKRDLLNNIGLNFIPRIYVENVDRTGSLILRHEHDGRDLELSYAKEVVNHISTLWEDSVKLHTVIEDEPFEI